jgi:hypothetical protein
VALAILKWGEKKKYIVYYHLSYTPNPFFKILLIEHSISTQWHLLLQVTRNT